MLYFGLRNINRTFFLISKPLNMLDGTLFVFSLLLNMLFLLLFAVFCLPCLLLILRFSNEKYIHCTLLVSWQSPKTQFLPFRSRLVSKNISGTLFIVCLSLYMFYLPFSGIFTRKCINYSYLLTVYTLNPPSTIYVLVYNR